MDVYGLINKTETIVTASSSLIHHPINKLYAFDKVLHLVDIQHFT